MSPGYYAFALLIVLLLVYSNLHSRQKKLEERIEALEKRSETEKSPQ